MKMQGTLHFRFVSVIIFKIKMKNGKEHKMANRTKQVPFVFAILLYHETAFLSILLVLDSCLIFNAITRYTH